MEEAAHSHGATAKTWKSPKHLSVDAWMQQSDSPWDSASQQEETLSLQPTGIPRGHSAKGKSWALTGKSCMAHLCVESSEPDSWKHRMEWCSAELGVWGLELGQREEFSVRTAGEVQEL